MSHSQDKLVFQSMQFLYGKGRCVKNRKEEEAQMHNKRIT